MKHKSAVIGFSYLAGLICASFLDVFVSLGLSAALILAGAPLYAKKRKAEGVSLFSAGISLGVYAVFLMTTLLPVYELAGQSVFITGTVTERGDASNDMTGYIISAEVGGAETKLTLYGADTDAVYGDTLGFTARLELLSSSTSFDEKAYYFSRGVFLKAVPLSEITVTTADIRSPVYYIRAYSETIRAGIMQALPGDTGAMLAAVFLGDKSGLSPELGMNIRRAGVSHFTAVSGLHLTLIAHVIMPILGLTPLKYRRRLRFAVLAGLIAAFMVFFDLSMSVLRAGIMLLVYYGADLAMRRRSTLNSLGFAVLLMLIPAPYAALDMGLLLSVAGTFGIGVAAPKVCEVFFLRSHSGWKELVVGNLCANAFTAPLAALFFGGVSLMALPASILIMPFFLIAAVCMLVYIMLGGLLGLPLLAAGLAVQPMIFIIKALGNLRYGYAPLDYPFIGEWVVLSGVMLAAVYYFCRSVPVAVRCGVIALLTLLGMVTASEVMNKDQLLLEVYTNGTSGCVVLTKGASSVIIATDDNPKNAAWIGEYLGNHFQTTASVIVLMESTRNAVQAFRDLPALVHILPGEEAADYDVSGIFTLNMRENAVYVSFGEYRVAVAHVSALTEDRRDSDVIVVHGYRLKETAETEALQIYLHKRQNADRPHSMNAFYEKIKLKFTE